ncbi:hypothetical protein OG873_39775 [Streptomyces violaceus]|uniref:hypothetical protein n=1 Tax=Streptomyces violaceus TaxID=1936 RepID=UPI002E2A4565|nr:hypothetical protein [Streptomyces violaceus]
MAAIVWGITSVIALNGVGTRPRVTTINLIGDVPAALQEHHATDTSKNDQDTSDSEQQPTAPM